MALKEKIYNHCRQLVENNIQDIRKRVEDLQASVSNETKSTAGDKYETARAMLHIEQEQANKQLHGALQQKAALDAIDIATTSSRITNGSLVKTNKGYLFISIGLGKAIIGGHTVFALSPQSPLGIKLMGLKEGDTTTINNTTYTIEEVL